MNDVAVAVRVGSPKSTVELVQRTFASVSENLGAERWAFLLSLGLNIPPEVRAYVMAQVERDPAHFRLLERAEVTWAQFINRAIDAAEGYEFFIKSHDDIELLTPGYLDRIRRELRRIDREVGWVSITDWGWTRGDFSPSVRPGYHLDVRKEQAWRRRKVFELHTLPERWWQASPLFHWPWKACWAFCKVLRLPVPPYRKPDLGRRNYQVDLPPGAVRCHGPFNHFVLIRRETLLKLGPCEDWGTGNALLVDEDWGLRAMQRNIPNVWVTAPRYYHNRLNSEGGGTRSGEQIQRDAQRVHQRFREKWGFGSDPSDDELAGILNRFRDTLIPWSAGRRTYEWDPI